MSTHSPVMLEVQSLNKKYGDFHAVKDLNFQVHKGEVLGFLGPNGAGKTTTMRIITCFIPLSSGSVRVDGLDILSHDLEIRRKIGYLPETTPLYQDMMVTEYLQFVGKVRGLTGAKLRSRLDAMMQVCNLTQMAHRQIGKLSKGFRQRVGLAQAMIHDPDLLILDEPTSGLDPNQIIEIRQLIKNVGEKKTVIYCSHILSEVSATCSRILIINQGQIVAAGTSDELTSRSTSGNRYHLKLRANQGEAESKLRMVRAVANVKVAQSDDDWLAATVTSEGSEEIGENLFKCVVDNGWSMSELKHEAASLEDVFTQLTRG